MSLRRLGPAGLLALPGAILRRFVGRKRLRFTYLTGSLAETEYAAFASRPGWRASRVEVESGLFLRGLVRRPSSDDAPWVLFYPGNDAAQLRSGQEFLLRLAESRDWGLASFAYRGYDGSHGEPYLVDLARDAEAILLQLCETEKLKSERLHLAGFSIGGHMAVRACAAAARSGRRVASLSLLASVDDIVMLRRSRLQRLAPGDDFQTRPLLGDIPGPVLVVHGDADAALGGNVQGLAIAKALGPRARYEELPGVGHEELLEQESTFAHLRELIAQHS